MLERVVRIGPERGPPRRLRLLDPAEVAVAGRKQHVGDVAGRIVGETFRQAGHRLVVVAEREVRLGGEVEVAPRMMRIEAHPPRKRTERPGRTTRLVAHPARPTGVTHPGWDNST